MWNLFKYVFIVSVIAIMTFNLVGCGSEETAVNPSENNETAVTDQYEQERGIQENEQAQEEQIQDEETYTEETTETNETRQLFINTCAEKMIDFNEGYHNGLSFDYYNATYYEDGNYAEVDILQGDGSYIGTALIYGNMGEIDSIEVNYQDNKQFGITCFMHLAIDSLVDEDEAEIVRSHIYTAEVYESNHATITVTSHGNSCYTVYGVNNY